MMSLLLGLEKYLRYPFFPRLFAVGHQMSPLTRLGTMPIPLG
jgi:hypothetical protein